MARLKMSLAILPMLRKIRRKNGKNVSIKFNAPLEAELRKGTKQIFGVVNSLNCNMFLYTHQWSQEILTLNLAICHLSCKT